MCVVDFMRIFGIEEYGDQRKGRCGRVAEGVCIRLYSEEDYQQRDRYTTPEILRTNLSAVILQMKSLRLGPGQMFPFLDPPKPTMIKQGFKTLHELGAVDEDGVLSKIGWQLATFPVDPRVARMLIAGHAEDAGPVGVSSQTRSLEGGAVANRAEEH